MAVEEIQLASRAYERNVISCAINNSEMLELLDLPVAAFESDELRVVYSMITDLKAAGHMEINIDTLRMFYDSRQDFYTVIKEHGGYKFLESLNARPDFSNFKLHRDELGKRHEVRLAKAHAAAALEEITAGNFTDKTQVYSVLDQVLNSESSVRRDETFRGLSQEWLEEQREKFERGEFKVPGIPIEHRAMRDAFGPFWYCGSLVMWAAETGVGKSQLVHMLVRQGHAQGIPSLVLDNEMEAADFRNRYIASNTHIPFLPLVTGAAYNPRSEYYATLRKFIKENQHLQELIEWDKLMDMRMERVEPIIRRFLRRYPVDVFPFKQIIVDGIKLRQDSSSIFAAGFFAQELKEFAGTFANEGVVVHATCQLQRPPRETIKDKASNPPDVNSIGLSKLISDNAAVVAILTKTALPDFTGWDRTKRNIYVPKNRFYGEMETNSFLSCAFDGMCSLLQPMCVISSESKDHAPENTPGTVRVVKAAGKQTSSDLNADF